MNALKLDIDMTKPGKKAAFEIVWYLGVIAFACEMYRRWPWRNEPLATDEVSARVVTLLLFALTLVGLRFAFYKKPTGKLFALAFLTSCYLVITALHAYDFADSRILSIGTALYCFALIVIVVTGKKRPDGH